MGLEECLSILQFSNRFPHSLLDELDSNVDSVLIQQDTLAATLQSQENLLAEEKGIQRVQEDMQHWISQQAKLKTKMTFLLEEKNHLEVQLREVNEKLETTQVQLAQTNSRI